MTAPQATIFQYVICGCVLYGVISCLILIWQMHIAPTEPTQEPPQSEPQPYNVVEEAERVLYGYQQSEVDAE